MATFRTFGASLVQCWLENCSVFYDDLVYKFKQKKRNPIRGAAIVEKLEYINKQNSVVNNIRFNYLLLFSGKK